MSNTLVVASRQRTEAFTISQALLGGAATVNSNILRCRGYGTVLVLVRSDVAGTVRILQSVTNPAGGPTFVQTDVEASGADPLTGEQVTYMVANVVGEFMRVRYVNGGVAQAAFEMIAYLLPSGGGGAGGGGGGGGGGAADVRNADADADFAAALFGMLTNSREASLDNATGDWRRNRGNALDVTAGTVAAASVYGPWSQAVVHGYNQTGAPGATPIDARSAANMDGVLATSPILLAANAVAFGRDSATGFLELLEARNFDAAADVAAALVGLVTNSRLAIADADSGAFAIWEGADFSSVDGSLLAGREAAYVAGLTLGRDTTGAAVLRAVEARNADATADYASALIGLLTNARCGFFSLSTGDWLRWTGDNVVNLTAGIASATWAGPFVLSATAGQDTTGAAVLRPVEARNADTDADFAAALIGLTTNSRLAAYDSGPLSDFTRTNLTRETSANTSGFLAVAQGREKAYIKSVRERLDRVGQGRNVTVTGVAAYAATSPSIIIVPAATNELIIRAIRVQTVTQTGTVRVDVVIDPDNRYSSGGTSRTVYNPNLGSVAADAPTQARDGAIVATAEDGDERDMGSGIIASAGGQVVFEENDGMLLAPAGSILIYVNDVAGSVAPTFVWEIEYEAANVQ